MMMTSTSTSEDGQGGESPPPHPPPPPPLPPPAINPSLPSPTPLPHLVTVMFVSLSAVELRERELRPGESAGECSLPSTCHRWTPTHTPPREHGRGPTSQEVRPLVSRHHLASCAAVLSRHDAEALSFFLFLFFCFCFCFSKFWGKCTTRLFLRWFSIIIQCSSASFFFFFFLLKARLGKELME